MPATPSSPGLLRRLTQPFTRRLQWRIVVLFVGLLLGVQLASFMTIRGNLEGNAARHIDQELQTGEKVLRRLLAANAQNLSEASRVLAADFGFRAAIASGDRDTLADVLDNHSARIGAEVALFEDVQRRLVASTAAGSEALPMRAPSSGGSTIGVFKGRPFQLVTVPVRAPQVIGYVSMGFPINWAVLQDVEQIAGLRTALAIRAAGGGWQVLPAADGAAPSAPPIDTAALARQLTPGHPGAILLDGGLYSARIVTLADAPGNEAAVILLQSVDEAVAPFRSLQLILLAINAAGLVVFAIGSIVTARTITRPLQSLSRMAERLGAGDYSEPVAVRARDEVRDLARSFEAMRQGMQQREAQIRRLAYWDTLTGLPNRAQFHDTLGGHLRRDTPLSVLMLDLDRFKHVNDVLGHAFGDRLLRQIAGRLTAGGLRQHDMVARLGSDKFAVLLPHTDVDIARDVAVRLRRMLEQPLTLDDHTIDVSAGIGIAVHPAHGKEADQLMVRAEMAMYAAKSQPLHEGGVTLYDPGIDSSSEASLSLLTELRAAVAQDQLRLFLQPKIAMDTGAVVGAEALVRWQHPVRGMIPPMQFIPFAEQTGFIRELTGWMIERCSMRYAELQRQGIDLKFAINLSTRDLLDQNLPAKMERLFSRGGVRPQALCLEITESAIMDDPQRALQTLQRLHAMGLRLSIDDFGTGYSSLAYLKRLPLHELKIDRSFVMAMETDRADLKIVRSTIDLAHNLGLTVCAEGVENTQTWALLKALRCDEAQGYLMGKPMPEAVFAEWLTDWAAPQARLRTEFAPFI
ncbi:EAL domain-containing protein [Aquincola sp. MAHUQ-54]|uniref:EAL domain-containing protein n=1 Tax=Aquincola agrisoli TaxID=3119538 RepID=A0AAW9QCJ7_9BURK